MTRGHPPHVAIGEAERKARAEGVMVFALEPEGDLPFHFVICDRDCISLVRVRRLKYPGYGIAAIEHSCKNDIAALRAVSVTPEIFRKLWVRGPDRHWYRYLVLRDSIEPLENDRRSNECRSNEGESHEEGSQEPGSLPVDQGFPLPARQPENTGLPENTGQLHTTGLPDNTG
jgi:hypothetical protein